MRTLSTTRRCLLLIAALVVLQLSINEMWLRTQKVPVGCDVYAHLHLQLLFYDHLASLMQEPTLSKLNELFWSPQIAPLKWPRFTYLVSSLGTLLFGRGAVSTIIFTNGLFSLVMLLALFDMGRRLYGPRTGLFACLILVCFPFTHSFSRLYGLDYPLAAMVTLTLAVLLRTDGFRSRAASLLLALMSMLTLTTKLQGVLFLIFPVGLYALQSLIASRRAGSPAQTRAVLSNLGLALGFLLAMALLLYYGSLREALGTFFKHTGDSGSVVSQYRHTDLSAPALLYYPVNLALGLTPLLFIFAGLGMVRRRDNGLLTGAILVPLGIFSLLISAKWARFLLPLLPLLALVAADDLMRIRRRALRTGLFALCMATGLALMLVMTFHRDATTLVVRSLRLMGQGITSALPKPPVRDNNLQQLGRLTRYLARQHKGAQKVRVGVVEDIDLWTDDMPLTEYITRLLWPDNPLRFVRSISNPHGFFDGGHLLDHVVVFTRDPHLPPRDLLRAVFHRYQQARSPASNRPYPHYDYLSLRIRELVQVWGTWPVRLRLHFRPDFRTAVVLSAPRSSRTSRISRTPGMR